MKAKSKNLLVRGALWKNLIAVLLSLAFLPKAQAQNWTRITAFNIQDLSGAKLASGSLCFQATDASSNAISFQAGGGGQVIRSARCAAISNGTVGTFTVPNPANSIPAGIFYEATVKAGSHTLLDYKLVQWSGASFNFDNYAPTPGTVVPPSGGSVNGPLNANRDLSVTGNMNAAAMANQDKGGQVYNVKAPIYAGGAVGNDTADDTAAITAAYTAAAAVGKTAIFFPPGTYKITSPLTIRGDLVLLYGYRAKLDFSSLTSGTAITITGAGTGQPYYQLGPVLDSLEIAGPGSTSSVNGILFNTAAEAGTSHLTLHHVNLHDFAIGHNYGVGAYIEECYSCNIWNTVTAINVSTMSTERISYFGGTFSSNGVMVNDAEGPADIYFTGVSADFNTVLATINGGEVFFTNSHAEFGNSVIPLSVPVVTVTGNGGYFSFTHGMFINDTLPISASAIVTSDASSQGVYFDDVFMHAMQPTSDFFATGTGPVSLKNITSWSTSQNADYTSQVENVALDGGFESASGILDDVFITQDTAPVAARFTGTDITLTQSSAQAHSGTKSLEATKTYGPGSAATFLIKSPIPKESIAAAILWYAKPGTQTGTLVLSSGWAGGCYPSTFGTTPCSLYSQASSTTITVTSTAIPWTAFYSQTHTKAPPWATHFYVAVSMGSMDVGSLYFDDYLVTTQ
jgi:hypothetical protein